MPNEELVQKKNEQLNKTIRVTSTHKADVLTRQDLGLYNQDAVNRDIDVLNELLGSNELVLENEERARLEAIKGRNLSSLLILKEKTGGDSKLMKNVKKAVAAVEVRLNRRKEGNAPFSPAEVESIIIAYEKAILTCRDYMVDKDPKYEQGKDRYNQVRLNMIRLHREAEAFMVAKNLLETGVLNGQVLTAHELLVQAKVYGLGNGPGVPAGPVPRRPAFDERVLLPLGDETNLLYLAFSGKETPSDLIARLSKSKKKKDKQLAKELPGFFVNIRNSLSDFREGKVAAKFFLLGDQLLSVSQNVYGQLSLNIGRNYIPIERGSGLLGDMLATDIVKNKAVYGEAPGVNIIRDILSQMNERELNTEKRQILLDYLGQRTGRPSSYFSNFSTNTLGQMITALFQGKRVRVVKRGKQPSGQLTANDVIFTEEESRMINIMETKELLQTAAKQENREKVKEHVSLQQRVQQREAEGVAQNADKQKKEQKKAGEWDSRESKIKNLLGDLMFSYETWDADNQVFVPGLRIKTMLLKNSEAVAELVADLYRRGGDQQAVINGIVDQLPLFALENPAKVLEFKHTLRDTLEKITNTINENISKQAFFAFGKALEDLSLMELQEDAKRIQREYEAAKREEENKKNLQKGSRFTNFFRKIGQITTKAAVTVKNKAVDLKDESVKNVRFIKTNQILKHLTNPQALITGNKTFGIPGIKAILEGEDMETFIDIEQSLEESVEEASEEIQETVSQYANELFHPQEGQDEELPNPYEDGLSDEEIKTRKRERYRIGNERLAKRMKDSIASGESGQGLFIKTVFENYFKGVATMDKRAMLASMIRNAKPVGKLLNENDPSINPDEPNLAPQEKDRRTKEKTRRHEYNEKLKTDAMANYIGGLLKGAGPLFQKMMQGLPLDGIPEEIRGAVEDMKSNLAPIPDEIVEAQLDQIVKSSHRQIKHIAVIKPLGAASVGQTFLCKLTHADGTEEECAVKLLKPDVRNRMMREKKLMIDCARQTDIIGREKDNQKRTENGQPPLPAFAENEKGGMQVTYEGQLERIEEELDLTIEARNVELGKIYDVSKTEEEQKVVSMKLNKLIAPTTNAMVLDKAPGETLDALLKRIKAETKRLKDLYKRENYIRDDMPEEQKAAIRQRAVVNPYFTNLDTICLETGLQKYSKEYEELEPLVIEAKLCALLTELKKKKAYLEAYAAKWTREGIFEGGFYHGDPHDGNIMISDEKLTVIDFGNCTKLTKEQQEHVTRMMAAAAIGDMKTFRHGFHKLLKPEFEALYQEKRDELGRKFSEIFALGDKKAAGPRIAVALLEAQKLGLEIPAAVFNFSQGQMRIQNALDNMNRQIEETEAAATFFVDISDYNNQFDCTNSTRKSDVDQRPELLYAAKAYTKDLMFITDDREELKRLMAEYPDHMKTVFFNKFKTAARTFDGAINGFRQIVDAINQTPVDPNDPIMVSALRAQFDLALQQTVDRNIGTMSDPALRSEMRYCLFERLTGQMVDEQKANSILERLRLQKDNVARIARAYDAMEKKYNKISAKHKNMWNPTDQEKAEFDVVCNQFLDLYFPLHMQVAPYWSFIKSHIDKLIEKNPEKREEMGFHMSRFFQRHPFGREEFMLAYNDLIGAINAGLPETNPAEFRQKRVALAHVYQKVMAQRLREKDKLYQAAVEKRKKDFPDVMSDIVDKEISKMISRMGLVDSVIFDWKLSKITKEEDSVQENTNNDD